MLLDEPTNHMDITAIEWLEDMLRATRQAYVLISHDRRFLERLTRATLWVDRGQLRRQDKGFADFEAWRDKTWADEDAARHKLDRKIKAEAKWAIEGISARRKRNQGRVRALQDLRAEKAAQIKRQDTAAMALTRGAQSGRKVIKVQGLTHAFGDKKIVQDLTLTILRQDRIALVGPNGVGKTSLLNLLMRQMTPNAGTVKHGSALTMAVFDQNRAQLDPDQTLWDALITDPAMAVAGSHDQVMVRGAPRHVVGYLKEFLFDKGQARAPVRSLSGGEKARLLLARIMARESNLLVLDEPTNDLDIETLDLLQDVLGDYDGTVLLVSHDRDFIDRVATTTLHFEGQGGITVYAGGWSDMLAQRGQPFVPVASKAPIKPKPTPKGTPKTAKPSPALSFTQQHRLDALPREIERLEAEIAKLEEFLSDPDLFTKSPMKFQKATQALVERQTALTAAEEEWFLLEEKGGV